MATYTINDLGSLAATQSYANMLMARALADGDEVIVDANLQRIVISKNVTVEWVNNRATTLIVINSDCKLIHPYGVFSTAAPLLHARGNAKVLGGHFEGGSFAFKTRPEAGTLHLIDTYGKGENVAQVRSKVLITGGSYEHDVSHPPFPTYGNGSVMLIGSGVVINDQPQPPTLIGDFTGDGLVNVDDLNHVIANWGEMDVDDLNAVISNWGASV